MIETTREQGGYEPDLVFPPGETLREVLEERSMSQAELAARMKRPKKTISEIVNGKAAVTGATALELETVLGVPAAVWSNLQRAYDGFLARKAQDELFRSQAEFLKEIPVAEMVRRGWVPKGADKVSRVRAVFSFFAVSSLDAWREKYEEPMAAFRAGKKANIGARAVWYRAAELELEQIASGCPEYRPTAFKRALVEVRRLTRLRTEEGYERAVALCRGAGVLLALVREVPGGGVSGATLWRGKTPGIVLTLRWKRDDQFWFSFFHEAGHVLLHQGKVFLEVDAGQKTKAEREADEFAANSLIPAAELQRLTSRNRWSKAAVEAFAEEIGICPGIVVGRLQHEGLLPRSHLNDLKRSLQWTT